MTDVNATIILKDQPPRKVTDLNMKQLTASSHGNTQTYWIILYMLLLLMSADLRWDGQSRDGSVFESLSSDRQHTPEKDIAVITTTVHEAMR